MYTVAQLNAAEKMLDLIAAVRDGKVIEGRARVGQGSYDKAWFIANPERGFALSHYEYRVKPEPVKPKEIWVHETESATVVWPKSEKHLAIAAAIHYREVIPEVDKLVLDTLHLAAADENAYSNTRLHARLALKALGVQDAQ